MSSLELSELVKHYPAGGEVVRAVDGVSLTVAPGEFVALYGPSGSGKTTLLLMAAGLMVPDAGKVMFGGRDISRLSARECAIYRRREVGFVFQSFHLIGGATAIDNTALKLLADGFSLAAARIEARPWLARVGLTEREMHTPQQLSMGERQRVAIARALVNEPRLLLTDEPTGNLDSIRSREIHALLRDICHERGIPGVLVTHDPQAIAYVDRVHTLRDGCLVEGLDAELRHHDGVMRAPAILGIRVGSLAALYRWRLRQRLAQELLAASGIAIGVALVFGVLLANTSITGSADRLIHQLVGSARLQLAARSANGFDEHYSEAVGRLPGVEVAAPVLRENATIVGAKGRRSVQLIGVTPRLAALGSAATQNLGAGALLISGGVGLPASVASAVGVRAAQSVGIVVNGRTHLLRVRAVLGSQTIGAVSSSPVVIALLPVAQLLTGRYGRVTNVLIKPRPGAQQLVARELRTLVAGRIDVESANNELRLLEQAAQPNAQSTNLFAAISGMIGFLLALNAMLLTVPDRRRFIAELRTQGFAPSQVILVLAFQALVLGAVGSLAGLAIGDVLAHTLFGRLPGYLTFAFPIGSQQILTLSTVLIPVACGMLAALLASLPPLLDLRRDKALDAVLREAGEAGQSIPRRVTQALGIAGLLMIPLAAVVAFATPSLTVAAGALLALAVVCLIPFVFALITSSLQPLGERVQGSMLAVALVELRATATRSIALAAVAALAVFGSVTIGGARDDLLAGIDQAIVQYFATADIWVVNGNDVFNINGVAAGSSVKAIERIPGVDSVRSYQGGLLDVAGRRLWLRARPPDDSSMIEASQVVQGNVAHATALIRRGGWAAVSAGFANEHHLHVGQMFSLPTPSGVVRFGVGAVMTNSGWPPGEITVNANDYRRYWETGDAAALEVNLKAGADAFAVKRSIEGTLGAGSGLWARTAAERTAETQASARQGLRSLQQISTLLLIAGALAIAASLSAVIWQRRARLAAMKSQGFDHWQLWRSLILESAIVLAIGCVDGAVLGIYGHALADRWLRMTTGFPAPFAAGGPQVFLTLLIVTGIALAVMALPGLTAAHAPPRAGFQE